MLNSKYHLDESETHTESVIETKRSAQVPHLNANISYKGLDQAFEQ